VVLTEELAFRLERAANVWGRAWMAGIEGIELGAFGPDVLAPCHRERPDLDFQNRVNGLTPNDAGLVPAIVDWYAEREVRPWFELVPSDRAGDLLAALTAVGVEPIGHHGFLVTPHPTPPLPTSPTPPVANPKVDVGERVVDPDDEDAFATFRRVRTEGHDLPAEVVEQAARDLAGWRTAPAATLYLATVDGEPAATAALSVHGGVGYLADGATLPRFRGRGLQSALIHRRLADATAAGCDVAGSQASFGSTSNRNLQRAGLVGGFTKRVLRRGTQADPRH
jgi:GNAT superfamily N-acetyltransferase